LKSFEGQVESSRTIVDEEFKLLTVEEELELLKKEEVLVFVKLVEVVDEDVEFVLAGVSNTRSTPATMITRIINVITAKTVLAIPCLVLRSARIFVNLVEPEISIPLGVARATY
jgi:hypothetical protein